jgi:2-keto-4-pentenoate hydratase/2-oxohepta-3-ene-1,7-dioic acid hydratase in catechol pathway
MRWVRFRQGEREGIGYLKGKGWVQPVQARDLREVMAGQDLREEGEALPLEGVTLLAPLRPGKIIGVGNNYLDHCREQGISLPEKPILFAKFPTSVIGPGEEVRWPRELTRQVDYEGELAAVIGKQARDLREEEALEAVFGYTIANDISARDLQFGDGQWLRGKALDTFLPLGPMVVTKEEVPNPQNLPIRTWVNGRLLQDSHTGEMIFPVSKLLAFISQAFTLEPGDLILTGTPHGVGYFRDPQVFLQPGDVVEVAIGDLGLLRNPVGPEREGGAWS